MNLNMLPIARILLDSKITSTPLRVFAELKKQGKTRVPSDVQKEFDRFSAGLNTFRFVKEWVNGERITRHNRQWVINSFLPPFPGKAFDRMFENLLTGRRLSPVSAYLAITSDCACDCIHCSIKNRKRGSISGDKWVEIIESLEKLGTSIIGFTGGEPLLRPDIADLVHAASSRGIATMLFTSGINLNLKLAGKLKKAGLWALAVSMDSPDSNRHDEIRKYPGAFEKTLEAVRLSVDTGFYTMVTTVAFPETVDKNLHRIIYETAIKLGADEYRLVEPMPCGKLSDSPEDFLLSASQIKKLRRFHVDQNRKGRRTKICAFNQIESPELFGCGGGTQHLYIDHNGEVCPCDFTPMSFGNAQDEDLKTIWGRMTAAMGNPRRNCFIRKNFRIIHKHSDGVYPVRPGTSLKICKEAGTEPLPDYFALVTGQK